MEYLVWLETDIDRLNFILARVNIELRLGWYRTVRVLFDAYSLILDTPRGDFNDRSFLRQYPKSKTIIQNIRGCLLDQNIFV